MDRLPDYFTSVPESAPTSRAPAYAPEIRPTNKPPNPRIRLTKYLDLRLTSNWRHESRLATEIIDVYATESRERTAATLASDHFACCPWHSAGLAVAHA
jgi:hypothetical protein